MALFFFPLDELYIPIPKYWSWKNYVTPKVPSNPKAWSKTSPVWEWLPPKRCWHHFLKSKLIFPSPEIADNPHPAILGRVVGDVVFLLNSWRKREKLLEGGFGCKTLQRRSTPMPRLKNKERLSQALPRWVGLRFLLPFSEFEAASPRRSNVCNRLASSQPLRSRPSWGGGLSVRIFYLAPRTCLFDRRFSKIALLSGKFIANRNIIGDSYPHFDDLVVTLPSLATGCCDTRRDGSHHGRSPIGYSPRRNRLRFSAAARSGTPQGGTAYGEIIVVMSLSCCCSSCCCCCCWSTSSRNFITHTLPLTA